MTDLGTALDADRERLLKALRRGGPAPGSRPIPRVDRTDALPASFAQRQLWFLDQMAPGSAAYLLYECVRLRGVVDVAALRRSLEVLVRRHEALRTVFSTVDGEPVQVVLPDSGVGGGGWDVLEMLEGVAPGDAEELVGQWSRRPFDLTAGPLLRALLVEADGRWVFGLCAHHVAVDGWSMGVLLGELSACYSALADGETPVLAPVTLGYADFAVWQREALSREASEPGVAYWLERLAGAAPALALPFDRPRPAEQSFQGGAVHVVLGAEPTASVRRLALASETTLSMVLLGVFDVLLARLSGQADVVVGVPVAGRGRVELESLVGCLANTVVMRTDLTGDPSFAEVLGRVRETMLGAFAHQDVPFEVVVERLAPPRQPGHNPVFQVMFSVQNAPGERLRLPGVEVSPFPLTTGTSRFDLWLNVDEQPEGTLWLCFEYDSALVDETTGAVLGRRLPAVVGSGGDRPCPADRRAAHAVGQPTYPGPRPGYRRHQPGARGVCARPGGGAGAHGAGRACGLRRRPLAELCGAGPARRGDGRPPAEHGGGRRVPGGGAHGPVSWAGGGAARGVEGGRRLCAGGPVIPGGAGPVPAG